MSKGSGFQVAGLHTRLMLGAVLAALCSGPSVAQAPPAAQPPANTARPTVQRMAPLTIVDSAPGARLGLIPSEEALDDIEDAKSKKRCIPADFIRQATVKDDKTIDLDLSGGRTYAIKLKDKCHGLGFDKTFYYYLTPSRQLCARFDTIVTRSGSRCIIEKIVKRKPDKKKSADDK
jgi:Family of unknown function (DUF6491)